MSGDLDDAALQTVPATSVTTTTTTATTTTTTTSTTERNPTDVVVGCAKFEPTDIVHEDTNTSVTTDAVAAVNGLEHDQKQPEGITLAVNSSEHDQKQPEGITLAVNSLEHDQKQPEGIVPAVNGSELDPKQPEGITLAVNSSELDPKQPEGIAPAVNGSEHDQKQPEGIAPAVNSSEHDQKQPEGIAPAVNGSEHDPKQPKDIAPAVNGSELDPKQPEGIASSVNSSELDQKQPEGIAPAVNGSEHDPKQPKGIAPIKPEYILQDKQRELNLKYVSNAVKNSLERDSNGGGDPPRKKFKGQNKARPHHQMADKSTKLCFKFLRGHCPFEKCDYKHDTGEFLENKEPDIADRCYLFERYGRCRYGVTCRFAGQHLKDGRNITDENVFKGVDEELEKNSLSKDLQIRLRKKNYDFSKTKDPLQKIQNKNHLKYKDNTAEDHENIKLRLEERKVIDFRGKLYLAPLTTVGNLPFRRICKELGADITCGEMAMATNILQGQMSEWALLRRHPSEDIFGVQLCGGFADVMARCAQMLEEQCSVDFIDVNMGCPIDFIYKKGAGAGLMNRTNRVNEIVYAMTEVSTIPLTLKMRAAVQEDRNIAHKIIEDLKPWASRISLFTVHGRSREQRYTRMANWKYIGQCLRTARPEIPLFGNGDVLSFEDYERNTAEFGVDGILLARGALIKPWIFTEIKERRHWDISSSERFGLLKKYTHYGLDHWGSDTEGVERTRRFLLEWLSFLHRYVPVGLLEVVPQKINDRPPFYRGRDDMETLMASPSCADWVKISEMLLGPVRHDFSFLPKHKANAYG